MLVRERRRIVCALVALTASPLLLAQVRRDTPRSSPQRIGFLSGATAEANVSYLRRLRAHLAELHWREGMDYELVARFADGDSARLPSVARELVALRPDVVLAPGFLSTQALANATTTIPIVFLSIIDPVGTGLVATLNKPGRNLTGITKESRDLSGKRVQLLKEAVPGLVHVAIVFAPNVPTNPPLADDAERAAKALGIRVTRVEVHDTLDTDTAVARAASSGAQGFVVFASAYTQARRRKLIDDALIYKLPGSYYDGDLVESGGFMSYAASLDAISRSAVSIIDRILKGANPAEIPVQQPTSFELRINLGTSEKLGIVVPDSLKVRAELVN